MWQYLSNLKMYVPINLISLLEILPVKVCKEIHMYVYKGISIYESSSKSS